MKAYVIGQNPQTLEETLHLIHLSETVGKLQSPIVPVVNNIDVLEKKLDDLTQSMAQLNHVGQPSNNTQPRCYNCHTMGHIARECTRTNAHRRPYRGASFNQYSRFSQPAFRQQFPRYATPQAYYHNPTASYRPRYRANYGTQQNEHYNGNLN
jgi:hypothetical protein